jgi:ribosomal protein L37E
MVSYLDFANLYQASDEEIASFLAKHDPLGFRTFKVGFDGRSFKDKPTLDRGLGLACIADMLKARFEELKKGIIYEPRDILDAVRTDPEGLLSIIHDMGISERSYYEESPDNIRDEAGTMQLVLFCYRQLNDYRRYRRFNDAKSFVKRYWEIFFINSANAQILSEEEQYIDEHEEWNKYAKEIMAFAEEALPVIFESAAKGVTLAVKKDDFSIVIVPSCLMADLWYQLVRDLLIDNKFPGICNRCGRTVMFKRPETMYCEHCYNAAKQRRYRERNGHSTRRGRPPKVRQ